MRKLNKTILAGFVAIAPLMIASPALAKHHEEGEKGEKAEMTEGQKLYKLFAEDDEASLKRNPLFALFRGDTRYADQFGDFITDEYFAAERKASEDNLAALAKIDRSKLNSTENIAYDVFERNEKNNVKGNSKELLDLTAVRPLNHFFGFHQLYANFASGQGAAPFKTVADYENNLKRHRGFVVLMDRAVGRFREGMTSGVLETKLTIGNVVEQLDTQLAQKPEKSPYFGAIGKMPEDFSDEDKARFTAAYRVSIEEELFPVLTRLRDFLRDEYLSVARESVGLSQMKGGAKLYEYMIEQTTTLPLKADDIHTLGLSEVARIKTAMEEVKAEVGFEGSLAEFFNYLRHDPKFKPESREALTQGFYDIGKKVDEKISTYFKVLPKAPLKIKPYEPYREKFQAGGSYQSGTPDGSRPGTFYFNAYDLPSRTTPGMVTLYLHEGAPGHHFQISLAQENEALPAFMRFGGVTAYSEGWGLYSETLGYDMGFYDDPIARFGTLSDEMLRAMRLVVDTGLHSKEWSREQAIKYMMDNSDMGETDATAEVERYIAIPTQALAYKIGALKIQELRKRAKDTLGKKFDIREFHNQVLNTGALPMTVLEKKIDGWIASQSAK
ncbi:MAG: DUF885 domain-containing protein [Sphingorhabdus sp.]